MSTCPRRFEAEAMRDGRLGPSERTSFAHHATTCRDCKREIEALATLADRLREGHVEPVDELHARRERTRLLAAFDRELVAPTKRERSAPRRLLALGLAVAGAALAWRAFAPEAPSTPAEHAAASIVVQANDAIWSKVPDTQRDKVVLDRGELRIKVDHARGARSVLVVLPDGELEDTGTTFTVSVEHGRTARVEVEEGSVLLKLRDQAPLAIRAGGAWRPEPEFAPPSATTASSVTIAGPALVASAAPARSATAVDAASAELRAAMATFDRGEHARAAAAFAAFVAKHPRDARAEDAAYLRVIALERSGDRTSMREAGRDYLAQYPTGFRSNEVAALTRD